MTVFLVLEFVNDELDYGHMQKLRSTMQIVYQLPWYVTKTDEKVVETFYLLCSARTPVLNAHRSKHALGDIIIRIKGWAFYERSVA